MQIVFAMFFVSINYLKGQFEKVEFSRIDLNDLNRISFLDDAASKNNIILFGEGYAHGLEITPKIQLSVLKYLNQYHGYNNLIVEYGISEEYLYNHFLKTGDWNCLKYIRSVRLSEWKSFWNELYDYNLTLPTSQKIRVTGIDFEGTYTFYSALNKIIPDSVKKNSLLEEVTNLIETRLSQADHFYEKKFEKTLIKDKKYLRRHLSRNNSKYQKLLQDNYEYYARILNNPNSRFKFDRRDVNMTRNFNNFLNLKSFGVLGQYHTVFHRRSFAKLSKSKGGKIWVCNIHCFNCNSEFYDMKSSTEGGILDDIYYASRKKTLKKERDFFRKNGTDEIIIVDLNQNNLEHLKISSDAIMILKNQKSIKNPLKN